MEEAHQQSRRVVSDRPQTHHGGVCSRREEALGQTQDVVSSGTPAAGGLAGAQHHQAGVEMFAEQIVDVERSAVGELIDDKSGAWSERMPCVAKWST